VVQGAVRGGEGAAGGVQYLAQVVGGGRSSKTRPEEIHRLLAVQEVAFGEGEQLHEAHRLPKVPLPIPDGPDAYGNPEAAENPHPHRLGPLA
jgi:hypothetical protein